jgi:hypothetical protein
MEQQAPEDGDRAFITAIRTYLEHHGVRVVEGSAVPITFKSVVVMSGEAVMKVVMDDVKDVGAAVFGVEEDGSLDLYVKSKSTDLWMLCKVSAPGADDVDDEEAEDAAFEQYMKGREPFIEEAAFVVAMTDGFHRMRSAQQRVLFARPVVQANWGEEDVGEYEMGLIESKAEQYSSICVLPLRAQASFEAGGTKKSVAESLGISAPKAAGLMNFPVPEDLKARVQAHPLWASLTERAESTR